MRTALPDRRPQGNSVTVVAVALLLLISAGMVLAQALRDIPPLQSRVTDLTGTLSGTEQASIEAELTRLETDTGSQVAVLVLDTTAPEAIEQYSLRVAEAWRLGRADIDDGVLFLVALADRRMRIEVGYGLEGALPDARANRIINDIVAPLFRSGDFAAGIAAGTDAIATVVRGEDLPLPERRPAGQTAPDLFSLLPLILIFSVVLGGPLKQALGTLPGALITGGLAGAVGWLIVGILGSAILIGLATFFVNLLTVAGPGSWSSGGGGYRGGYGGGFGGGGGGGFGGGGGGFGGGGASGGW